MLDSDWRQLRPKYSILCWQSLEQNTSIVQTAFVLFECLFSFAQDDLKSVLTHHWWYWLITDTHHWWYRYCWAHHYCLNQGFSSNCFLWFRRLLRRKRSFLHFELERYKRNANIAVLHQHLPMSVTSALESPIVRPIELGPYRFLAVPYSRMCRLTVSQRLNKGSPELLYNINRLLRLDR